MKLSIRKKIFFGFSILLGLLLLTGLFSIKQMNNLGNKATEVKDSWMPRIVALGEVNVAVSDVQRLVSRLVLENVSINKGKIETEINETLEKIKITRKTYEGLIVSQEEKQAYKEFSKNFDDYIGVLPDIIEAGRTNDIVKAQNLIRVVYSASNKANDNITSLIQLTQRGANRGIDESVELFHSGVYIILLFSLISIISGIVLAWLISVKISNPILLVNQQLKEIAEGEGDLTKEILIKSSDEIGELTNGFNKMVSKLRDLIQQVRGSVEHVVSSTEQLTASAEETAKASEQITSIIQEVAVGSENQVRSISESSEAIHTMSENLQQIASNTKEVSVISTQASQKALQGNKAIQATVLQMDLINSNMNQIAIAVQSMRERSTEINKMAEVISHIAAQTNLLALNAAIEAARAGEHGKGFAVVAGEVRKLAEQSALSAQQVSQLIVNIQKDTETVVKLMESGSIEVNEGIKIVHQQGETFQEIKHYVDIVSNQAAKVSIATENLSANMELVVQSITLVSKEAEEFSLGTQSISATAEEQSAAMEEIADSVNSLSNMAEELQLLVGKFKV